MSTQAAVDKVFSNELLLEKIFGYALFANPRKRKDVTSCRIVNTSWLRTVSKLCRIWQKPLVYLGLFGEYSRSRNSQQTLVDYMAVFTAPHGADNNFLPTSLTLNGQFFRNENYNIIKSFLSKCGDNLIELRVTLPSDGGSMPVTFPNLYFPMLRNFAIKFTTTGFNRNDEVRMTRSENNVTFFVQSILNGCEDLKRMELSSDLHRALVPSGFKYMCLPSTIREIKFSTGEDIHSYNMLLQNDLPNLKKLQLDFIRGSPNGVVIENILSKFSGTLKSFSCEHYTPNRYETPNGVPPVMKKLRILEIDTEFFALDVNLSFTAKCFPMLSKIVVTGPDHVIFLSWLKKLPMLSTVRTLNINFHPHHVTDDDRCDPIISNNFNLEMIEQIHKIFPNLVNLAVSFLGSGFSGLRYIFCNMTQLQVLDIETQNLNMSNKSITYISALLGIPEDLAAGLIENPNLSKYLEKSIDDYKSNSIRNLAELRSFKFDFWRVSGMKSEALFQFGFLKIPRLRYLSSRKIDPSTELRQIWRNGDRDAVFGKFQTARKCTRGFNPCRNHSNPAL